MRKIYIIAVSILTSIQASGQDLSRRSFFGIQMEELTDDVRRVMKLPEQKGVLINNVVPASTAELAGLKRGDVLVSINGNSFENTLQVVSYVAAQKSGTPFNYEIIRDGHKLTDKASFKPYPYETYPDITITYEAVKTVNGLQRMIISKPKNASGKLPVIFFIGGIGCYSLDSPFDTSRAELQVLNYLTRKGYMTVRLEKPGVGDAAGSSTSCGEVSFNNEVSGYIEAIKKIKARTDVNSKNTYVFGHSMGGVMAPLIAKQTSVSGVIAYGTIGSNFLEYLMKTRRTIAEAYNMTPDSADNFIRESCECATYYFAEKKTTEQAAAINPTCKEFLPVFDLRSRTYNDELYALNIPGMWSQFKGNAMLIWGSADFIAAKHDHEIIADAINYYHNGKATFTILPAATHGMEYAKDFHEGLQPSGQYNAELGKIILNWLQKNV